MGNAVSSEVRAWVRPGLPGAIAVADPAGTIEVVRLWALRFRATPDVLEAYVQRSSAARALALLGSGGRAAFNAVELPSYRSRTFKGHCRLGEGELDHAFIAACATAMQRAFSSVGMPDDALARMMAHADSPALVSLWLEVDAVFDQTPKQGAGGRL